MIRVDENIYIDVDEQSYTVKIDKHSIDKKGNQVYKVVGYYGNLENAIKGVIKYMNKMQLSEGVHTLEEAVKIVASNNKKFEEILERAVNNNGRTSNVCENNN